MSYGVNVTNIYELLSEDGEVQISKQTKVPAKATVVPAKQSAKPQAQSQKQQTPNSSQAVKGSQQSSKPQNRPPRQQKSQVASASEVKEGDNSGVQKDFQRRERKRGTYQTGAQRTFDRRSGTGRGRENKKGGAGRGNWGTEVEGTQKEQPTEEKGATEEKVDEEKKEEKEEKVEVKEEEPEEEKDNTKTFEEYLAEKEAKKLTLSLPESRKLNEGADPKELKKWEKYQVLKREFSDEEKEEEGEEEEEEETTQKKSKKQTVPLNEVFDVRTPPIRTGGRGRGRGRGGSRGGDRPERSGGRGGRGGRGGGRGSRGGDRPAEIKIDEQSFPALKPKA